MYPVAHHKGNNTKKKQPLFFLIKSLKFLSMLNLCPFLNIEDLHIRSFALNFSCSLSIFLLISLLQHQSTQSSKSLTLLFALKHLLYFICLFKDFRFWNSAIPCSEPKAYYSYACQYDGFYWVFKTGSHCFMDMVGMFLIYFTCGITALLWNKITINEGGESNKLCNSNWKQEAVSQYGYKWKLHHCHSFSFSWRQINKCRIFKKG